MSSLNYRNNALHSRQFDDLVQQQEFLRGREKPAARVNSDGAFGSHATQEPPVFNATGVKERSLDFFAPPPQTPFKSKLEAEGIPAFGFPQPSMRVEKTTMGDKSPVGDKSPGGSVFGDAMKMLKQMSLGDIATAQSELADMLDPSVLDFLKKSGQRKISERRQYDDRDAEVDVQVEHDLSAIRTENQLRDAVAALPEDSLEKTKLMWTMDGDAASKTREKNESKKPRFHLNGSLISDERSGQHSDEANLYHHAQDPDQPGFVAICIYSIFNQIRLVTMQVHD